MVTNVSGQQLVLQQAGASAKHTLSVLLECYMNKWLSRGKEGKEDS